MKYHPPLTAWADHSDMTVLTWVLRMCTRITSFPFFQVGNGSQVILPSPNRKPQKGEDGVKIARVLAEKGDMVGTLGN